MRDGTGRAPDPATTADEAGGATMEMFLMVGALSLLGVAVCAALFAAATRP